MAAQLGGGARKVKTWGATSAVRGAPPTKVTNWGGRTMKRLSSRKGKRS